MANISKPAPNLTTRANEDEVATPNRYKELTDETEESGEAQADTQTAQ